MTLRAIYDTSVGALRRVSVCGLKLVMMSAVTFMLNIIKCRSDSVVAWSTASFEESSVRLQVKTIIRADYTLLFQLRVLLP